MSPACASFDMFRNYPHRAEVFRAAVQALADEAGAMLEGGDGLSLSAVLSGLAQRHEAPAPCRQCGCATKRCGAGASACRLRPRAALGHGGAAGLGPGDGVFGLHRDAGQPAFGRYAHTYFLSRHALFLASPSSRGLLAFQVKVETWERVAPWLFVARCCC
jgi:hypothetical protein